MRSFFVSTFCVPHNSFGRTYLRVFIPFHRWGLLNFKTIEVQQVGVSLRCIAVAADCNTPAAH